MAPEPVTLEVRLVAKTEFVPPADVPWETDADGGEALAEFAGRLAVRRGVLRRARVCRWPCRRRFGPKRHGEAATGQN